MMIAGLGLGIQSQPSTGHWHAAGRWDVGCVVRVGQRQNAGQRCTQLTPCQAAGWGGSGLKNPIEDLQAGLQSLRRPQR